MEMDGGLKFTELLLRNLNKKNPLLEVTVVGVVVLSESEIVVLQLFTPTTFVQWLNEVGLHFFFLSFSPVLYLRVTFNNRRQCSFHIYFVQ